MRATLTQQKVIATHAGLPADVENGACASVMARIESGSGPTSLLMLNGDGGVPIVRAIVGKNRVLKVRAVVGGMTRSSGVTVSRDVWHEIGVCAVRDGGSLDQVALLLGGNEVGRWTLNNGNNFIDQVRIGTPKKATAAFNLDNVSVTVD